MVGFDREALRSTPHEVLVRRAGSAVGFVVLDLLRQRRGHRVVVIAGPGSNGADGHVAAAMLRARGVHVDVVAPDAPSESFDQADLVVDAGFGTGLARPYVAPSIPDGVPVVAVDIPSGLDGTTGALLGNPLRAERTVTMQAIKAGLLLGHGPEFCGQIDVADIGISTEGASMGLVDANDLATIPPRRWDDNKWSAAVTVVAGSKGMEGAAALCSLGAMRAGSGMVRLITLASDEGQAWPTDVVRRNVDVETLVEAVAAESSRAKAIVVGPGLGLSDATGTAIRQIISGRSAPMVVDADAITAVGNLATLRDLVASAPHPVVITPHDGELSRLLDAPLGADRLATLRHVAEESGAIVLSKGATTVIAAPPHLDPITRFVTAGTPALATAGTGDVLGGVIAALCARGVALPLAASLGAFVHGTAGKNAVGTLLASDLPNLVGELLGEDVA